MSRLARSIWPACPASCRGGDVMASARLGRVEDLALITGAGSFVADVRLPRMVEMAVLRSGVAHGRLARLDCAPALSLDGVLAAVGAGDLVGVSGFPDFIEAMRPIGTFPLAVDRVRYVGAPVAAVVAEDRFRAEDAIEAITVEYEPFEAVTTLEGALAEGAPLLYEDWPDNRAVDVTRRDPEVERILASSRVVRASYRMHRQAPTPMETRGSVASFVAGRLTLWTGTQSPHIVRTTLSTALGLPEGSIRVVVDDVGGSFGSKTHVYPEDVLVAWLAMRLGRPIRWIEDRAEHFMASVHARDQLHELEAAIDGDGRILALRAQITCDIGSGEVFPAGVASSFVTAGVLTGPYRIPHAEVGVTCVVTNKTPSGAYRGFGTPEAVFAMERLVERIACETGRDPLELRREMLLERDALPYTLPSGSVVDSGSHRECFDRAVELGTAALARARAERPSSGSTRLGVGFATYLEGVGASYFVTTGNWTSHEMCTIRVEPDGSVVASVGVTTTGQGVATMVATVVAEALGVSRDSVLVDMGDTDRCPYGIGGLGSRSTIVASGAIGLAASVIREKVLAIGAHLLEAAAEDLELVDGRVRVRGGGAAVSLARIATLAWVRTLDLPDGVEPGLQATAVYDAPGIDHRPDVHGRMNACATYTNGSDTAVVEVDVETGRVEVLSYAVVHDCGRMINPPIVAGQIRGAVAQAIGGALYEEICHSTEGEPLATSFMGYLVPTSAEIPEIVVEHLVSPAPGTPLGVKGAGESGTIGPAAAIANAVSNALAGCGVDVTATPLSPSAVRRLIRESAMDCAPDACEIEGAQV